MGPCAAPHRRAGSGRTTTAELNELYGIELDEPPACTLSDLLEQRLGPNTKVGSTLHLENVDLVARELHDGVIEPVGLVIRGMPQPEPRAAEDEAALEHH